MLEEELEEVELSSQRDYDGPVMFQPFSDNDTTTLFQDLERELEKMVQKYRVPPTDLENLFQVVQNLFEMMDTSRETYESLEEQKKELEDLWKNEKDKSKVAQRRKLELECRMEEDKLRLESEKGALQRDKASLETKLRQAIEHKLFIEQDLIRLKERTIRDEQARRDLLDTYKKQYDKARRSSLRRGASLRSIHRRLPIIPTSSWEHGSGAGSHIGFKQTDRRQTTPDSFQSSEDSFPHSVASGTGSGASEPPPGRGVSQSISSSAAPFSPPTTNTLEMELEREGEREERDKEGERGEGSEREQTYTRSYSGFAESYEEMPMGMQPPPPPPAPEPAATLSSEEESDDEGAPIAPENRGEGISLEEELMEVVSPELLAPAKAELEMLQNEKESWKEEKERLEREREEARSVRENLEGQYARLQVDYQQIQNKHNEMMEELTGVRQERDEVLEMYLDQPFEEYCITRKELLDLLRRHHHTAIELEREKEEKQRLQNILDAKKSFFERFKQSMKKMFNRYPTARPSTSSTSSDHARSYTPSDDQLLDTSHSELSPPPAPPSPLTRTVVHSLAVRANRGWLCSQESSVSLDTLPHWIGQITLSGIETERVECAAVGRVFSSEETLSGLSTPPRTARFNRRPSSAPLHGVQQVHAEVWIATTEESTSFIEIIDILSRTSKVRQRFVVKPSTAHIVSMKAIPGSIEESSEFTDSALIDVDTSWVAETFTPLTTGWRRGSMSDLLNSRLTPPTGGGAPEATRGVQFTQSLSLPTSNQQGAGQKASGVSAVGEVTGSGAVRRLEFSGCGTSNSPDRNSSPGGVVLFERTSSPDGAQPLSQSLTTQCRNQDTILEAVDGGGSEGGRGEGVWGEMGRGGRMERRRRRTSSVMRTVMWVVTEDNRLVFYPTTDPSHVPINSIPLPSRALCIEFIKGKVYIGHSQSDISVFHPDEFMQDTWDIHNPDRVTLPSSNAAICYDVKCITAVGSNEIWVGAGPSIFFLDEQTLERRGSKFIDNWHHRPEQILAVGDLVLVATRASTLYVFDRERHDITRRFDVNPVSSLLVSPPSSKKSPHGSLSAAISIKSLATDDKSVFIGTSNGRVVTIPVDKLPQKQALPSPKPPSSPMAPHSPKPSPSPPQDSNGGSPKLRNKRSSTVSGGAPPRKPPRKGRRSKGTQTTERLALTRVRSSESSHYGGGSEENDSSEQDEEEAVFLEQSAVSLHCHKNKVRTLLHITLPRSRRELASASNGNSSGLCFNSMPNLSGPGYRLPLGQPLFKSLVVSVGRGHTEYSVLPPEPEANVEDASARRERNKSFQLMLWGHRNSIP